MIHLRPYNDSDYKHLDYQLSSEQALFTSSILQCKEEGVFSDLNKLVISVIYHNIPIGFFILDNGNDKFKLTNNESSLLIRSFSINSLFQGKGLGKKSMLLINDYIHNNFPNIEEIVLSVNLKNKSAYHTYLNAGFTDTQRYIQGIMGNQYILSKKIWFFNF